MNKPSSSEQDARLRRFMHQHEIPPADEAMFKALLEFQASLMEPFPAPATANQKAITLLSKALPAGIHSTLAALPGSPRADLDLIRKRWKVVTLATAKERETPAAKLLRFLLDLHAALLSHPRPAAYDAAPGSIVYEAILAVPAIEGDPNPNLPASWMDPLLPVWQSWLEADNARKRCRETVGQKRNAAGEWTKNPKHDGKFKEGNPLRYKKR
jgi:hypothetical protein